MIILICIHIIFKNKLLILLIINITKNRNLKHNQIIIIMIIHTSANL